MKRAITVEFSDTGWRQFACLNRSHGARFIKGFVLRRELAAYIAAYKGPEFFLDATCQELHYSEGIYLLMKKCQGVWYITEIWSMDAPIAYAPVFIWRQISSGFRTILRQVLVCWRVLTRESAALPAKAPI